MLRPKNPDDTVERYHLGGRVHDRRDVPLFEWGKARQEVHLDDGVVGAQFRIQAPKRVEVVDIPFELTGYHFEVDKLLEGALHVLDHLELGLQLGPKLGPTLGEFERNDVQSGGLEAGRSQGETLMVAESAHLHKVDPSRKRVRFPRSAEFRNVEHERSSRGIVAHQDSRGRGSRGAGDGRLSQRRWD